MCIYMHLYIYVSMCVWIGYEGHALHGTQDKKVDAHLNANAKAANVVAGERGTQDPHGAPRMPRSIDMPLPYLESRIASEPTLLPGVASPRCRHRCFLAACKGMVRIQA
jgi:hypothetical protein